MRALALSLRHARWRHPEWAVAAAAGVVWVALLVALVLAPGAGHPAEPGHAHAISGHHVVGRAHGVEAAARSGAVASWAAAMAWWLAMTAAMMLPSVLPTVRNVALTSLWSRRQRNVTLFLSAYLAAWATGGLVAVPAAESGPAALGVGEPALVAGTLAVAAGWELTPWKRRALRACHLVPPLPPHGRRADRACLTAGLQYGRRCLAACWALMAAMAVAGHAHLALMILLTAVVAAQRLLVHGPRLARPIALALATTATFAAVG